MVLVVNNIIRKRTYNLRLRGLAPQREVLWQMLAEESFRALNVINFLNFFGDSKL